ncbi:RHS repeat protein [Citrobacter amalonaticus]|nr:RHS repeat protein [Citrobacter amalonaticus]
MSKNYYTHTPNFISSASEDVDPRTRLFGFQHHLGIVTGNNGMGPELELTMSYSPTTSKDYYLLGIGVSPGLTTYDKNSFTLNINTGEQYITSENVDSDDDYFEIKQCKIKSFIAEKLDKNNYRIIDHDGNTTNLQDVSSGVCLPVSIYSPLGRGLYLEWNYDDYGRIYLQSVTDDNSDTLYYSEYDKNNKGLIIKFLPESQEHDESYTLTFSTSNGYLTHVAHSALSYNTGWNYTYTDVGVSGLLTLTKIQTPTGLTKEAVYNGGLTNCIMMFPDGSGQAPLPAVTQLTVTPGFNQPPQITTFAPVEGPFKNYLGWGGQMGAAWSPDSDNLYNVLDENYQYQTVETLVSGDPDEADIVTTYIYNSYHLLLSRVTTQAETTYQVDLTYYALPGNSFDQQPPQFQFRKLQKETWSNDEGSYSKYTGSTYDEDGNLTKKIDLCDADGAATVNSTITDSVYYSVNGESDSADMSAGCPADPVGFPRWLKSETITSPVVSGYDDVPVITTLYRYQKFDVLSSAIPLSYAIFPVQETHTSSAAPSPSGRLLSKIMSYYADSSSSDYGRPLQQQLNTYDINDNSGNTYYSQAIHFSWQITGDMLSQSQIITTHDGNTVTNSMTSSRLTQRVWSVTDAAKNITEITYDPLGRVISEVRNKGTEYESINTSSYYLETLNNSISAIYTIKSDDLGNASRIDHDSMGRLIKHQRNAPDFNAPDTWSIISTTNWDSFGRQHDSTSQDYTDPSIDNINANYSVTAQAQFDHWGQQSLTILSTGQNQFSANNPVLRSTRSQLQVADQSLLLGSALSEYNVFDTLWRQSTLDSSGKVYAQSIYEYDGLGQLRKETDPLQRVTTYTYDPFGRIATKTLPNGDVLGWTYEPFSYAALANQIKLNNRVMGSRTFDGLGRIWNTASGGRQNSATYSGEKTVPDTATNALGQTLSFSYISELNNSLHTVNGATISQSYAYEKKTGRLQAMKESGSRSNTFSWYPSGQAYEPTFTNTAGVVRSTSTKWTLMGQPLSYRDVGLRESSLHYDDFGRLHVYEDPQVTITLTPDPAGRLSTQKVEAKNNSDSLLTTLYWDDFSREQGREIKPSSGSTLYIGQTFYLNNQLETRTITLKGETEKDDIILRNESFLYDERSRLTKYTCIGSELPVDAYGNSFTEQHFELDSYSNILSCLTTLSDGSVDTAIFNYENEKDPCQLTSVSHSLSGLYPDYVELHYNDAGYMTTDEAGRTLTYDEAGRLTSVTGTDGGSEYAYDAFNQLVMQSLGNQDICELYYNGERLMSEINTNKNQITRNIPGVSGTSAISTEPL